MRVTIRTFAIARDALGFETRALELQDPSLEGVKHALIALSPDAVAVLDSCRFAVNKEYAGGNVVLKDGDEIALIPPVSGG